MTNISTHLGGANGSGLPLSGDLLHGADEIAEYIYGTVEGEKAAESNRRRVYHAIEKHGLPAFKLGGTITARRSTILNWIEAREKAA